MVAISSCSKFASEVVNNGKQDRLATWRRKATAAVSFHHASHTQIVDQLTDGHLFITPDGLIGHANPAAGRVLEQAADDLVARELTDVLKLAGRTFQNFHATEIPYVPPHGPAKTLEISCSPIQIGGELVWYDVAIHDVSVRHQRYEQLRVQSIVLDQLSEIVTVMSPDGGYLYCNRTMCEFWGYSREEVMAKTPEDLWGVEFIKILRGRMQSAFDAGDNHFSIEYAFRHKDGHHVILDLDIRHLHDNDGNVIGRVSVARDITERRRMETELAERGAELQQLLRHIPAAITRWDRSGRLTFCNDMTLALLGKSSADEVIGRTLREIDPSLAIYEADLKENVMTGREIQRNFVPLGLGKTQVFLHFKLAPLLDEDGRAVGGLAMAIDVTAEREARNGLISAKIEAETANRSKSEFLANMSHELRTPLNAIIGFSDLLASGLYGPLNEKQEGYCRDIYNSGGHLLSIIGEILDLSKIEAGRFELDESDVDIAAIVASSLSIVQFKAQEKRISIEQVFPPTLPKLHADTLCVKQILLNLLSNAVKFTQKGGHIRIGADISPSNDLVVTIQDNGVGIPEKDMAKLFEPFAQADSGRARLQGGTGLGLSICKRMMDMHQGGISLSSQEWSGTTATLTFPAARIRRA